MDHITIKSQGLDEAIKLMRVKAPIAIEKMAGEAIGNVADIGRQREQSHMGIGMGKWQHTVEDGVVREGFFTTKTRAGWVSTSYMTSKGPFRMASFAYERVRKPGKKKAWYTSQLANLWAEPTKPYSANSPFVGRVGQKHISWEAGKSRLARYSWSRTVMLMHQSVGPAIARTYSKWKPKLENL